MFQSAALINLADQFENTFKNLHQLEQLLNKRFIGMEDAVSALILSVASGEPLLLIGPPGTAKSRLIRAFCGLIGLLDEDHAGKPHDLYFEYLLTPFTEPGELFGFYDIPKVVQEKKMERLDRGMMQNAEVVYLDEVFNGSSAILNSILSFLNERMFHDHGTRKRVKMECLFAASNDVPESPELRAVFDRFSLRCRVNNVPVDPGAIGALLQKGWSETYGAHERGQFEHLLEELKSFRKAIKKATENGDLAPEDNHPFYRKLSQQIYHARQYDLSEMSNRRLVKMVYIMLVHRIYEAVVNDERHDRLELGSNQLGLLPRFFLDRQDEELTHKMIAAAEA